MLVFDARAGGAWTRWTLPHQWFGTLSVERDRVALYCVTDGRVLRYTDISDFKPRDDSGPEYPVVLKSGRLTVSPDDGREWTRLLQVLFVFSELNGPVRLTVRANTPKRLEVRSGVLIVRQDLFGQSAYQGAEPVPFSGADTEGGRGEFSSPSQWSDGPFIMTRRPTAGIVEVCVRINKDVNFLEWELTSLEGFLGLQLKEFVYEYVRMGVGPDFSGRYNAVKLPTERG